MESPCRVLVLNERDPRHPSAGGAEIHIAEIFGRLASRGYDVTLATSSFPGAPEREDVAGLHVERLGRLRFYYPRVAWKCARDARRGRYDVVVECLNKVPFYSPTYSKVPVLAVCHHLFGQVAFQQVAWPIAASVWTFERFIPPLYRDSLFLTISESSRDDLVERGLPKANIRVSHCGIKRPAIEVDPTVVRRPRIAYVGRLEPYKNIDVLLRAMASLSSRFPEATIDIIGRGSARDSLERLAEELGLAERTHLAGFVSDDDRDRLLANSRVCVCPSDKEGWGLTVIESNAVGTPVVASDSPGLRDSVRHGETGYLVRNRDVNGFAERIAELLEDDALATRMSAAALDWSRRFDWDRAASEMAEAIAAARERA